MFTSGAKNNIHIIICISLLRWYKIWKLYIIIKNAITILKNNFNLNILNWEFEIKRNLHIIKQH